MRHLFIIDPIDQLNPCHDSSVALMEAAQAAGDEVWWTHVDGLHADISGAMARAVRLEVEPIRRVDDRWVAPDAWYKSVTQPASVALAEFRLAWMRSDPPVDESYIRATHLLDLVDRSRCTVVNRPSGLRNANEKLYPLRFPELVPPTIVSNSRADIQRFVDDHGASVLKPLNGMAGRGIMLLRAADANVASIVDTATQRGVVQVMVQAFIAEVAEAGDRRVIVVGGEPIGVVRRVARGRDFRCNMAAGASVEADEVSSLDRSICDRIRADLLAEGLYFVGVDVIGDRVTEINVTSPTGLREIDLLSGSTLGSDIIAWATAHLS